MDARPIAWTGLLSPAAEASNRTKIELASRAHAQLAQDVNAAAIALIAGRTVECQRDSDYIAHPLFARCILDFEATVLLAGTGLRAQSRGAALSVFESACFGAAACEDHPTLLAALDGSHHRFRKNLADELALLPETPPEVAARLKRLSEELRPIAGAAVSLSVKTLADAVAPGLYTVLYHPLSQDAHPCATTLEQHSSENDKGNLAFKIGADFSQYEDTVLAAVASLLLAAHAYASRFRQGEEAASLEALRQVYVQLSATRSIGATSSQSHSQ